MLVYAVFADDQAAQDIAHRIVDERLAACANILGSCQSVYRWEDAVTQENEVPVLFKTTTGQCDALIARIAALHSYAIPAIMAWPATAVHGPFADWIRAETPPPSA